MDQIGSIKSSFEKWLERHVGANTGALKRASAQNQDVSIFNYSSEFKEYLAEKFNTGDVSVDLSSLLELEIADGKFVIPEDGDGESGAETPEQAVEGVPETLSATEEAGSTDQNNEIASILNNLFEDENFKTAIDTDNNGELSNEEISDFLKAISNVDGNSEDVSLNDILGAMQAVSQGEDISTLLSGTETQQGADDTAGQISVAAPQSSSAHSSHSSGGNHHSSGGDNSPKPKTLENMTEFELNAELVKSKNSLDGAQNSLSAAINGTSDGLKSLKDSIETNYNAYQTALQEADSEMAEKVNKLKTSIDEKQSKVNEKDIQISSQKSTVTTAENTYKNTVTTRETLEASLNDLKNTDTSTMTSEQKEELGKKILELEQTKIPAAKDNEKNAKDAWDKAKKDLETLEKEKKDLINGEGGLTKLQEQMKEYEGQITEKYPEVATYLEAYNKAKENFKAEQTKEISSAQTKVDEAQSYYNKVQNAVSAQSDKKLQNEYATNAYNAAEGQRLVDTAWQMLEKYGSSTGLCATGVSRTFKMAYGISMSGNGCDWDSNMEKLVEKGMFREVTLDYPNSKALEYLPAGAVVCWEATTGSGGGGKQYGHVTIADGHGGEISDHYRDRIYRSVGGRSDTYRVFIPI